MFVRRGINRLSDFVNLRCNIVGHFMFFWKLYAPWWHNGQVCVGVAVDCLNSVLMISPVIDINRWSQHTIFQGGCRQVGCPTGRVCPHEIRRYAKSSVSWRRILLICLCWLLKLGERNYVESLSLIILVFFLGSSNSGALLTFPPLSFNSSTLTIMINRRTQAKSNFTVHNA